VTTLEALAVATLALAGFISLCVLLVLVAASMVQREREEFRFRRELRQAIEQDASRPEKPARHVARAHSRSHVEPVFGRRPRA
jgi:hypothetical protein